MNNLAKHRTGWEAQRHVETLRELVSLTDLQVTVKLNNAQLLGRSKTMISQLAHITPRDLRQRVREIDSLKISLVATIDSLSEDYQNKEEVGQTISLVADLAVKLHLTSTSLQGDRRPNLSGKDTLREFFEPLIDTLNTVIKHLEQNG